MTTTYDWPASFGVNRFELRVYHNTRAFITPYGSTSQVLNYTGERWCGMIGLTPGNSRLRGGAQEAFFDRLYGMANRMRLWNFRRPQPLGTLRGGGSVSVVNGALAPVTVVNSSLATVSVVGGDPVNTNAIAIGDGTATLQTHPGRTLLAGDHIGLANGQNVRIMADATANGSGVMAIEFQPRARTVVAAGGAITWDKPTFDAMLKTDGAPITWRPGMYEETSLEFIEAI